jgi:hypothetical protein
MDGKKDDVQRITALFSALKDMASDNAGVYFKVALRSDIYFLVRTSEESSDIDKIEGSLVWQNWSNHEILVLLVKRIKTYFGDQFTDEDLTTRSQFSLNSLKLLKKEGKVHHRVKPDQR